MPVRVGTSGWQYRDWRGRFYPPGLPARRWLEHHAAAFATTEVNSSFYRLPTLETVAQWRARTPSDYVFAVKASRFLTHIRRLREPQEPVSRLLERLAALGDRLGPVLVQLPPDLTSEVDRLEACLRCFPPGLRVAVEPRHPSWWNPDLRAVLTAHRAALVWADRGSQPVTPLWRTADWGYLRLHAGGGADGWPYAPAVLDRWAQRLAETWDDEQDVYAYTNNDPGGAALRDAVTLAGRLRACGRHPTRVPPAAQVCGPLHSPVARQPAADPDPSP